MADVLPTPRAVPEAEEKIAAHDTRAKLEAALDELLKRYLLLLDQYTQARQQLSSDLSSGYISLAQANFNASNRVRYGQDFYDERMQALRRVAVDEKGSKLNRSIRLVDPPADSTEDKKKKKSTSSKATRLEQHIIEESTDPVSASVAKLDLNFETDTEPSSAKTATPEGDKKDDQPDNDENKKDGQRARPDDPIRWFGILVPPALRNAQSTFVRATEGPLPKLVNLMAEMRELEIEIGRARKTIKKSTS